MAKKKTTRKKATKKKATKRKVSRKKPAARRTAAKKKPARKKTAKKKPTRKKAAKKKPARKKATRKKATRKKATTKKAAGKRSAKRKPARKKAAKKKVTRKKVTRAKTTNKRGKSYDAKNKTSISDASVEAFLESVDNSERKQDAYRVLAMMKRVTRKQPFMWGSSLVGFGRMTYRYESGRTGEWFLAGFSPRKQAMTIYITAGFPRYEQLMAKLGKYKIGKSCLYLKRLDDVDQKVLETLIRESARQTAKNSIG